MRIAVIDAPYLYILSLSKHIENYSRETDLCIDICLHAVQSIICKLLSFLSWHKHSLALTLVMEFLIVERILQAFFNFCSKNALIAAIYVG